MMETGRHTWKSSNSQLWSFIGLFLPWINYYTLHFLLSFTQLYAGSLSRVSGRLSVWESPVVLIQSLKIRLIHTKAVLHHRNTYINNHCIHKAMKQTNLVHHDHSCCESRLFAHLHQINTVSFLHWSSSVAGPTWADNQGFQPHRWPLLHWTEARQTWKGSSHEISFYLQELRSSRKRTLNFCRTYKFCKSYCSIMVTDTCMTKSDCTQVCSRHSLIPIDTWGWHCMEMPPGGMTGTLWWCKYHVSCPLAVGLSHWAPCGDAQMETSSRMTFHVQGQMVWAREAAIAVMALEWFSTSVFAVVTRQLIRPCKPPFTALPRATVWLLSCKWANKKHQY